MVATISDLLRRARQRARAWRARLRHDWGATALLVLFSLSLAEPLACIIHCQIWLPLAFHDYFAAQHQHEHHHHTHQIVQQASDPTPIDTAGLYSADTSTVTLCGMPGMGTGPNAPFYVPPSPVHDMLLALALFFVILPLLGARPTAPPGDPPPIFLPRPLRPPIPHAT